LSDDDDYYCCYDDDDDDYDDDSHGTAMSPIGSEDFLWEVF